MADGKSLFGTYKQCKFCSRPLPLAYEEDFCPKCQEHNLFQNVKEFIRSNDVNEYEVADHFNIPLKKVKGWIREGRIEYKPKDSETKKVLEGLHCENCGAPVQFGVLCPKCTRELNAAKGYGMNTLINTDDSQMRYLDSNNNNQK